MKSFKKPTEKNNREKSRNIHIFFTTQFRMQYQIPFHSSETNKCNHFNNK